MAVIRLIILVCLLVISAECLFWPWRRHHNKFKHSPRNTFQLRGIPSLYPIHLPYDDILIIKSIIQDEMSNYDVIRKRIIVTKEYKIYDEEYFPGFNFETVDWWNNIPEDYVNDCDSDNNLNEKSKENSNESDDIEVFTNSDNNQDIGVNNNIGEFDNLDLDQDKTIGEFDNIVLDQDNIVNNDDSNNNNVTLPSNDNETSSNTVVDTNDNNKKPFVNIYKPDVYADEAVEIDPRKDEENKKQ